MAAGTGHRFSLEHMFHGPKGVSKPLNHPLFAVFSRKINMLHWSDPELVLGERRLRPSQPDVYVSPA